MWFNIQFFPLSRTPLWSALILWFLSWVFYFFLRSPVFPFSELSLSQMSRHFSFVSLSSDSEILILIFLLCCDPPDSDPDLTPTLNLPHDLHSRLFFILISIKGFLPARARSPQLPRDSSPSSITLYSDCLQVSECYICFIKCFTKAFLYCYTFIFGISTIFLL